jgi:transcriptional regulator of met regulon
MARILVHLSQHIGAKDVLRVFLGDARQRLPVNGYSHAFQAAIQAEGALQFDFTAQPVPQYGILKRCGNLVRAAQITRAAYAYRDNYHFAPPLPNRLA